ncbi:MAG: LysM peptidoglycan-binding domain-containing protein [Desulfobacteraceae bacterium]|nr:MAG: LysM peptidoglycan-binding domain-containing protein [Desulfobacteraceae bacterium]
MKNYSKLLNAKIYLVVFPLLIFASCATNTSNLKANSQTSEEKIVPEKTNPELSLPIPEDETSALTESETKEKLLPLTVPLENGPSNTEQESPTKPAQEMLDSALEFCQASFDFWDKGDLDNALDALDQAYSLVLKVNASPEEPEILQQKDDLRFTISKRIIECYSSRFTVANGYHKAIPLVMNRHVEKAIKLFIGKERKFFLDAYRRSGQYRPAIVKALKEAGLPEELSWLPLIESGFKVRAFSRARALGLWQFIASTGYKFGLKRDRWIDERMDPEKSTRAAVAYLKELHQIFGDWATVLAAYNCGEGTVLKRIRTQRINYLDNFWDLYRELPLETAFYFPKFLAVLHILNDPEAHGINLPPVDEEIKGEKVNIEKQVHLKTVATHLEVPYRILRDLNPELRYNFTPDRPYAITIPKDKGKLLLAKIDDIPVWHPPYVVHRVRRGESLSIIARRYRTSVRAIMAMNGLRRSNFIRAGWKLKIPTGKHYASVKRASTPMHNLEIKGEFIEYLVRKGDSLWKIANRFGTTAKIIQSVNQLNNTHLRIGQILKIPKETIVDKNIKSKTPEVTKSGKPAMVANKT